MALGGEMQDGIGLETREDAVDPGSIDDVDLEMRMPVAVTGLGQRFSLPA